MSSESNKSKDLIDQVIEDAKAIDGLSSEGYQLPNDVKRSSDSVIDERGSDRADLSGKAIELRFQSGEHFAKSYIENISVGGLFVRSEERKKLGEVVEVSFALPAGFAQSPLNVSVRAKVARLAGNGWGLEFISLDADTRHELETYVRGVLPTGVDLKAGVRGSTVEKLRELRQENDLKVEARRRSVIKISVLAFLAIVNLALLIPSHFISSTHRVGTGSRQTFEVEGKEVSIKEIRALRSNRSGAVTIDLVDGGSVTVDHRKALPPQFRTDLERMDSINPQKKPRLPINHKAASTMKLKKDGARKRH